MGKISYNVNNQQIHPDDEGDGAVYIEKTATTDVTAKASSSRYVSDRKYRSLYS
jgi:hypothetical protein